MIVTGKQLRRYLRNNHVKTDLPTVTAERDSMFKPLATIWETADTHETIYRFNFKDTDKISISNKLLKELGYEKVRR